MKIRGSLVLLNISMLMIKIKLMDFIQNVKDVVAKNLNNGKKIILSGIRNYLIRKTLILILKQKKRGKITLKNKETVDIDKIGKIKTQIN